VAPGLTLLGVVAVPEPLEPMIRRVALGDRLHLGGGEIFAAGDDRHAPPFPRRRPRPRCALFRSDCRAAYSIWGLNGCFANRGILILLLPLIDPHRYSGPQIATSKETIMSKLVWASALLCLATMSVPTVAQQSCQKNACNGVLNP